MMTRRHALALSTLLSGCGYHVGGKADLLPKSIQTIAIPALNNLTTRYKFADRLAGALTREFIARTRYQIIADPTQADAVLSGAILTFAAYPTIFDPGTGRAAGVQVIASLQLRLVERATNRILYDRTGLEFRERYEASVDQAQYFEESDQALDRMSRDAARTVVSAILEAF
ncbi:MAG TPA: LPS assembly lipoprotein LptE [Bryobacteraceae bacterium]|nr:LPS assembly lipoprotein LptE [Bryobacteraceae bacterium]